MRTFGAVRMALAALRLNALRTSLAMLGIIIGVGSVIVMVSSAKVAILGKSTAKQLFGDDAPLGQMIRIGSAPFEIIGVLSERGQSSVGNDQDDTVVVPASTARRRLFGAPRTVPNIVRQISVKVESVEQIPAVQADIESL